MRVLSHTSPRVEVRVGSIKELIEEAFVANYWMAPGFYQFVRAPLALDSYLLLAEFDGGARFYVVARLEGEDAAALTRALPTRPDSG